MPSPIFYFVCLIQEYRSQESNFRSQIDLVSHTSL